MLTYIRNLSIMNTKNDYFDLINGFLMPEGFKTVGVYKNIVEDSVQLLFLVRSGLMLEGTK